MPYTKKIIRDCKCPDRPDANAAYESGLDGGTEWACDICNRVYTLKYMEWAYGVSTAGTCVSEGDWYWSEKRQ